MCALTMYREGKTVVEIAGLTGTSQAVIRGYLKANGIYLRSKGPKNPYKAINEMRREIGQPPLE